MHLGRGSEFHIIMKRCAAWRSIQHAVQRVIASPEPEALAQDVCYRLTVHPVSTHEYVNTRPLGALLEGVPCEQHEVDEKPDQAPHQKPHPSEGHRDEVGGRGD